MTTPCTAPVHGTESAYRQGCRCPEAREERRLRVKRRRENRHPSAYVPVIGTQRRLRALAAIGWPLYELATKLGISPRQMDHYRSGRKARLRREAAEKIAALYDALSMTVGPSELSRERAARAGWAPPLLWEGVDIDDPNAQPAVDERPSGHRRIDLREFEFFTSIGMSREDAARRMGVQLESVERVERKARRANLAAAPTMRRALEQAFADEAGAA